MAKHVLRVLLWLLQPLVYMFLIYRSGSKFCVHVRDLYTLFNVLQTIFDKAQIL